MGQTHENERMPSGAFNIPPNPYNTPSLFIYYKYHSLIYKIQIHVSNLLSSHKFHLKKVLV